MTVGYFSRGKFTTDEWEKWVELYQIFTSTPNEEETLKTNRLANDRINLEIFKNRIDRFVKESIKKWEVEMYVLKKLWC